MLDLPRRVRIGPCRQKGGGGTRKTKNGITRRLLQLDVKTYKCHRRILSESEDTNLNLYILEIFMPGKVMLCQIYSPTIIFSVIESRELVNPIKNDKIK